MATPRQILVTKGVGNYEVSMNNSTDAVCPGHIVTTTGQTPDTRDVAWPDAASDIALGVVGCSPGHDLDTPYTVGEMMPVYRKGGRAQVWVRVLTSAGAIKIGTRLMHHGGTAVDGLACLAADSATLFNDYLGIATMDSPDVAAERWCMIILG